jgi:glycosyltransferase involved in cell wall biosynthesis
MPHIALVTTSYPDVSIQPGRDAAGSFVADFAAALAAVCPVTVVAPSYRPSHATSGNLTVQRFAVPSLPLSLLNPKRPQHWRAIVSTLWAGQHSLRAVCRTQSIDHILALWALPSGYWARRVGRQHGIPYSIWALGSDIWTLGKIPLIRRILQTVLRDSQHCFADGYQLLCDVEAIAGRPCHFLPSLRHLPLTQAKTLRAAPPYRLAYLGRWHPHKGVDLLLESLHQLGPADWQRIEEVRICGGGPLEAEVKQQAAQLRQAGRPVTVAGYLDKAAAAALFTWADYVLLPSRIESIPVVFSDAMQCLCPLVTMPVGDLPRLLQEHPVGILSRSVDAPAYTAALRNALHTAPVAFASQLKQAADAFQVTGAVERLLQYLKPAGAVNTV